MGEKIRKVRGKKEMGRRSEQQVNKKQEDFMLHVMLSFKVLLLLKKNGAVEMMIYFFLSTFSGYNMVDFKMFQDDISTMLHVLGDNCSIWMTIFSL